MNKSVPVFVTLLMIFSGLAGAMAPVVGPQGHSGAVSTTVTSQGTPDAPMLWNASDNKGYDALDYDVSVALKPSTGNITATAKIMVKALKAVLALNFTLMGPLKVLWVKDGSNNALVYNQNSTLNRLLVNLTGPAIKGQTLTVNVNYSGAVNHSISTDDNCNWTAGGLLKRTTPWYPMPLFTYNNDMVRPNDLDRHNITIHALVPGNWTVVALGKYVGVVTQGPNKNFTYRSMDMVAGATVAAGEYFVNTTTHGGITMNTYQFKANATRSGKFMDREIVILDWFTAKYGIFPYTTLNTVEVNHKLGGLEADQGLFITDTFGNSIPPNDLVVATADQYLYYATCPIDQYDMWLSWAMSQYAVTYFQLAVDGKNDLLKMHHFVYGGGTGEPAIKDVATNHNKFEAVILHKGPYVLHMLRYLVGNATFDGIMQGYVAQAHGKNSTLNDFMTAVGQKAAGTDLNWFFDQWLNTTQYLDYSVSSQPSLMFQDGSQMKVDFMGSKAGLGGAAMPVDFALQYYTTSPPTLIPKGLCRTCSSKTFSENITEDVAYVVVDPDMWLLDVNKDNDKTSPVKEDLVLDKLEASPSTGIIEGEKVTLKASVKNIGNDAQAFVIAFYANGTQFTSQSVSNLNPGLKIDVSVDWTSVKGIWNISALVDSDMVIKEYNETNNRKNVTLTIAEYIPPPDLRFVGPLTFSKARVTEGDYVLINVTVLNDYKRSLVGIYIDFRVDGNLMTTVTLGTVQSNGTVNASVNWPTVAGTHEVKAVLHAPPGVSESDTTNNEVQAMIIVNDVPFAKIGVDDQSPFSGVEVEFSGAESTDNVGIAQYKFDFDDGQFKNWSESPTTRHTYKFPGEYKATVTVRDNWGVESPPSDPLTMNVKDTLPLADFAISADTGTVYTVFSFTPKATDPDGNITVYYWDFGDGKSTNEKAPIHQFSKAGSFEVRLTVTDNNEQNSQPASKTITIKNLKPNVFGSVTPTEVKANDPVVLDAGTSWDPDNDKGDLKFRWTAEGTLISSKVKDTVHFSAAGNVHITLTVTDSANPPLSNSTDFVVKVTAGPVVDGNEPANNNMIYIAAAACAGIFAVILVLFVLMRGKKAKAAAEAAAKAKPVAKGKGKAAKPEAKPTKPAEKKPEEKKPPAKEAKPEEPKVVEKEAPKKPEEKAPAEAPKAPKPAAPKPKVVKKPAEKPATKPAEKPGTVIEKAKKSAEEEWEK